MVNGLFKLDFQDSRSRVYGHTICLGLFFIMALLPGSSAVAEDDKVRAKDDKIVKRRKQEKLQNK